MGRLLVRRSIIPGTRPCPSTLNSHSAAPTHPAARAGCLPRLGSCQSCPSYQSILRQDDYIARPDSFSLQPESSEFGRAMRSDKIGHVINLGRKAARFATDWLALLPGRRILDRRRKSPVDAESLRRWRPGWVWLVFVLGSFHLRDQFDHRRPEPAPIAGLCGSWASAARVRAGRRSCGAARPGTRAPLARRRPRRGGGGGRCRRFVGADAPRPAQPLDTRSATHHSVHKSWQTLFVSMPPLRPTTAEDANVR